MVLTYPGPLPAGALVRLAPGDPTPAPIWLDSSQGLTLNDAGRVTAWAARLGQVRARPVPANDQGTARDGAALRFDAGENTGLMLDPALSEGATLTLGLILRPTPPEARTLLSLQTQGAEDYLFLSLDGPLLRLAQRGTETELSLPLSAPPQGPLLILCALSEGQAHLSVNGQAPVSASLPHSPGPADLFLACRTARTGMRNKLGGFALFDVLIWPGRDLLAGAGTRHPAPAPGSGPGSRPAPASALPSALLPGVLPQDLDGALALWKERCRLGL